MVDKVNLFRMRKLIRDTMKLQWKIEQEYARATKITTSITGMPHGGSTHDKVENGAIQITEIMDAYKEILDELQRMRDILTPLIDTLDNADDRAVMRLRYIKGFSPEDIADAIYRTNRSIYYYLARAEKQLVKKYPDKIQQNG